MKNWKFIFIPIIGIASFYFLFPEILPTLSSAIIWSFNIAYICLGFFILDSDKARPSKIFLRFSALFSIGILVVALILQLLKNWGDILVIAEMPFHLAIGGAIILLLSLGAFFLIMIDEGDRNWGIYR
jgi:hypothetical protein